MTDALEEMSFRDILFSILNFVEFDGSYVRKLQGYKSFIENGPQVLITFLIQNNIDDVYYASLPSAFSSTKLHRWCVNATCPVYFGLSFPFLSALFATDLIITKEWRMIENAYREFHKGYTSI